MCEGKDAVTYRNVVCLAAASPSQDDYGKSLNLNRSSHHSPSLTVFFPPPRSLVVSSKSLGVSRQSRPGTRGAGGDGGGAPLRPVPRGGAGGVLLPGPALRPRQGEAAQRGGAPLRVQPGELREDAEGSHLRHDDLRLRLRYVGAAQLPRLPPSPRSLRCRLSEQIFLMLKPKADVPPSCRVVDVACRAEGAGGGLVSKALMPATTFTSREVLCR